MAAGRGYRRRPRLAALAFAALLLPVSGAWAQSGGEDVQYDPQKPAAPAFREAIEADDAARKRRSEKEGDSYAPTFSKPTRPAAPPVREEPAVRDGPAVRVGPPSATIPGAAPAAVEPPPESRAAAPDPEERPGRAEPPAAQYRERLPERGSGGEASSSPLDALLEVLNEPPGKAAWLEYAREEPAEDGRAGPGERRAAPVLPAALAGLQVGKGLYARTLYEANSDWPGPVVLEILEPPLAGAVATGAFQEAGERLVIRIDRFSLGRQSWEIEGWAVDPGCACYGIPGEVDRHWFQRVLLPSALAFAGGFLDAAARTAQIVTRDAAGNSITVESGAPSHRQQVYAGAAEAARRAGSVLLESVPDGPTVRVPRNTELVLVVTAPPEAEGRAGGAAPTRGAAPAPAGEAPGRGGPVAVIDAGGAGSLPGNGRAQ